MGLDVLAYNQLVRTEDISNADVILCKNDFVFEQSRGIEPGYYNVRGECYSFRAGSYSSYNKWRSMLSEMIGYKPEEIWSISQDFVRDNKLNQVLDENGKISTPFIELIAFSDCEGYIGPIVSNKLFQDFKSNRDKAIKFSNSIIDNWFIRLYDDFMQGFRIASNNGVVVFE